MGRLTTVVGYSDMDPSPRATILIDAVDVDPSAVTLDVFQLFGGVERVVRGARGLAAAGGVFVTDYEIPLGVEVTYQARQYDAAGAVIGLTDSAVVQVDVDPAYVVLQDPFAPRRAMLVEGTGSFAGQVGRSRSSSLYQVGRDTVALTDVLSKVRGVSLSFSTRSVAEADEFYALLEYAPLLVRTMPNIVRIPALFYCNVPGFVEVPMDVQWGGGWVRWDVSADEVSRPELTVLEAPVTWQSYVDAFVTWADMAAEYSTWLDAVTNPPAEA